MISNYIKIAKRNLIKNKVYSFINIAGLATGLAVAMLIGLWIFDELSFNKSFENFDRLAVIKQNQTFNNEVTTQSSVPYLMGEEIRNKYGSDFKHVIMSSWPSTRILAFGDQKISKTGNFMEPGITEMLSLNMIKGTRAGLKDINSIMLSEETAKALFGDHDPIDKVIKVNNKQDLKVTGVYKNIRYNSDFKDLAFIAPWELYINNEDWSEKKTNPWRANMFLTFVQIADQADMDKVSAKIKNVKLNAVTPQDAVFKPEIFLHPISKWHLYAEFKNGKIAGGSIEFVWLFGIIGVFVLLLACINFMNLSTARSEKRAKEVGIRKAIGSLRSQLITQFFSESLLVVALAFILSVIFVISALPYFNEVADKKMIFPWKEPLFWIVSIGFSILTGLVAGSYPALYLSSFQPIKVLKGSGFARIKLGSFAAVPRKVLVVVQFTISIILIIGTITVFRQIDFAKNRPVGYDRNNLLMVAMNTPELHGHYDAIRSELLKTGVVKEMSQSSNPTTYIAAINNGYEWEGKDPATQGNFATMAVSHDFGKTVGWQFKEGRDFSRSFSTDSSGVVINETAAKFMGLKNPVGSIIKADGKPYQVIGVIKDMIMESPYKASFRTCFFLEYGWASVFNIKINPESGSTEAINKIEKVFKKFNPAAPFDYKFTDEQYAKKFGEEVRIGKLTSFFAVLAIFISCLGLFGMATFTAEQRTKEIGVRKVLGASVANLWQMLSKDFVVLVVISCIISAPVAYYFLNSWLQKYEYRTEVSWWIFALASVGALVITLMTVSYQAIRAALLDPVKSLKSE
ncbi:ABC-type antimicrobial peptide transport system, permease component [Dyadobacter koreensis]|uniref:ABC-type antimicrobial peptide transport system, permease component n=1 Tax=Dyadobacter koreensis TaxID=408657 RepID=A0A1H6YRK6_9BACT|nr:ABC transporter permease [Dyadobacter koreensis]SEJ42996.1 ABC-type antimicrobial peptide transport system, permease component [Dyadobacter koreensis]